jgi:hypothetical protein
MIFHFIFLTLSFALPEKDVHDFML